MGHAYLIAKIVDCGRDLQDVIDLPRIIPVIGKVPRVEAEHTIPAEAVVELTRRGFEIVSAEDAIGGAPVIWIDWEKGMLTGASESRNVGIALGF